MRATDWTRGLLVAGLSGLLIAGCAAGLFKEETVAERFDTAMKKLAERCAKNPPKPGTTDCDPLKLKPADPLATEEGRFAHSIKIPNPVPEDSGYKPGMTPEQYFDHLCKTEAGEFIYKTVENVEGIYMMRPRISDGYASEHLYALEAPYGRGFGTDHSEDIFVQPAMGKYKFLELPIVSGTKSRSASKYRRFYRDPNAHPGRKYQTAIDGRFVFVPYIVSEEQIDTLRSHYGFTWRGIARPHDREHGVGGGELIIFDLQTNEVLAVRRGFVLGKSDPNLITSFSWPTGKVCPGREAKSDYVFLKKVLKPVSDQLMRGGQ